MDLLSEPIETVQDHGEELRHGSYCSQPDSCVADMPYLSEILCFKLIV